MTNITSGLYSFVNKNFSACAVTVGVSIAIGGMIFSNWEKLSRFIFTPPQVSVLSAKSEEVSSENPKRPRAEVVKIFRSTLKECRKKIHLAHRLNRGAAALTQLKVEKLSDELIEQMKRGISDGFGQIDSISNSKFVSAAGIFNDLVNVTDNGLKFAAVDRLGKIQGAMQASSHEELMFIDYLCAAPQNIVHAENKKHRGPTRLIVEACRLALINGHNSIELLALKDAIAYYESLGFKPKREMGDYRLILRQEKFFPLLAKLLPRNAEAPIRAKL